MMKASSPFASLALAATLALGVSMTLAYNLPPSATVLNQAAAWVGWGAVAMLLGGGSAAPRHRPSAGLLALAAALAVLLCATLASSLQHDLPLSLVLSIGGSLLAALGLAWVFARVGASGFEGNETGRDSIATLTLRALCVGLIVTGLLGTLIGFVQVVWPNLPDGQWVAKTPFVGRASGNLRQPNHLASLLMWSAIAAAWVFETQARRRTLMGVVFASLILGIVMTTSRTGFVGVLLMAGWAMFERRLSRPTRGILLAAPLFFALCWWGLSTALPSGGDASAFGGSERLHASDISSSRFAIWTNTVELLRLHPWAGVGIGEFNRAWTLTGFSQRRPVAFFDHTHNLPLQLGVELGLPLGLLVLGLLACALWRAARAPALAQRFAFMMLLMTVLHSQLEYPLWYAHFLLPSAAMLGLCLAASPPLRPAKAVSRSGTLGKVEWPAALIGLAISLGGIWMALDYLRVVAVYAPSEQAGPLEGRIMEGQHSAFFAHHGDYARVTTTETPALEDFSRASHYLLDSRLMIAWARAYAAHGDVDRARWIAARLREFHNDNAKEFFAVCDKPGADKPFQCDAPQRHYEPQDFR